MKHRAYGDNLIVKLKEEKKKEDDALSLPEEKRDEYIWGEVVDIGPCVGTEKDGVYTTPLKVGSEVYFRHTKWDAELEEGLIIIDDIHIVAYRE